MKYVDSKDVTKTDATGAPIFNGQVFVQDLVDKQNIDDINIGLVSFAPGSRTKMHTHSGEQILVGVEGKGIVATAGEEVVATPGMVFYIPALEPHWHGATPDSSFSHYSIHSLKADGLIVE